MKVTLTDRDSRLRDRIAEKLARVRQLRCTVHDQPVVAVVIDGRENGWFDSRSTTCCDQLEQVVHKILGDRC